MDIRTQKQELLNKLYEPYKKCQQCPLGKMGRKNIVFGEGNPDAKLMFVGEGPGQKEDELQKPFIGKSGQLLTKVLETVGGKREDVFITNVVKCRPPRNRKPLPKESHICTKLLLFEEIRIIAPTVVCTLGSTALQALFGEGAKITKMQSNIFELPASDNFSKNKKILLLPTFHPAFFLRNFKKMEILTNDIKLALKISKT